MLVSSTDTWPNGQEVTATPVFSRSRTSQVMSAAGASIDMPPTSPVPSSSSCTGPMMPLLPSSASVAMTPPVSAASREMVPLSPPSMSATLPLSPPSSSATPPQPSITHLRHKEFWLYDGSIVLAVENTLFRVHQTILATHSEVFADLFTIPQPDGQDTIDGCHVVRLYDDSEKDFADLLRAMYQPDHFDSLAPSADFDTLMTFVSGILRLSTKYMIRYLRQRCISLFLTKLPASFDSYEAKARATSPSSSSPVLGKPRDRYRSDTVMRAIKLAQDNDIYEALPYAYYCVSRFPHKRLLKERPGDISWKDKAICLVGRERLHWAQMSMSYAFLLVFQRSPVCQSLLCAHARGPHAEWHLLENDRSPHPLREYDRWDSLNVCPDCVAYCKARHLEGRKEVWNFLPTLFELPSWEELRGMQYGGSIPTQCLSSTKTGDGTLG